MDGFDSSVASLRAEFEGQPILRQFLEGKKTVYDVFIGICTRLTEELQILEKTINVDLPYKQRMETVLKSYRQAGRLKEKVNQVLAESANNQGKEN